MQAACLANGPETQTVWHSVDWKKANRIVRNLRQRIFRAICLSRMLGDSHVRFLGGWGTVMSPGYPTLARNGKL
jgi:hypothetical protein